VKDLDIANGYAMASSTAQIDTYAAVVAAFGDFLTVAIHTILYVRNIYPEESFLKTRKYNFPVQQNRHPKVCKWITDAVEAVETELLKVGVLISVQQSHIWEFCFKHFYRLIRDVQSHNFTTPRTSSAS
jgi:hypothetical protein